ncbi:MAG: phage protein Gp13 family protein [Candidatus Melainabacteria bacterium]
MTAYLKPATLAEAIALAQDLRPEDEAEIRAMSGHEPVTSLSHGIQFSDLPTTVMDEDGSILGMFGAVPTGRNPRVGVVWMLCSPKILKHRRQFAKESRQWIEAMHRRYDLLWNVVDERNTVHIRWLQWCGFTIIKRHEVLGIENRPFLEFVRIRTDDV